MSERQVMTEGGRHRRRDGHRCARCDGVGGYLIGREKGAALWLCGLHYEMWAELRKSPARQTLDRALWRLRRLRRRW